MRYLTVLTALICISTTAHPAEPDGSKLVGIRYDRLSEVIRSTTDRPTLVYFWGEFCPPCRAKYPGYVQLGQQLGAAKLREISVSLDEPNDPRAIAAARAFLERSGSQATHYYFLDKPDLWLEKLKMVGPPVMFLFDARGRLVQRWDGGQIDFRAIRERIEALSR